MALNFFIMINLLELIKIRQSSRMPFDPDRPVTREHIQQILEAGSWAPTAHNMQNYEVVVVDDKNLLTAIRKLDYTVSETFVQENYLQLSFSPEELKKKKTGVLSVMFPKSWLQPGLLPEHSHLNEPEHPLLERHDQMLSCPTLVILLYDKSRRAPASDGDFLGVMSLGCVLENMWLMAASLEIGFHVVSALANEPAAAQIKELLAIPPELEIALAFRLGYPIAKGNYLRVRRDVQDFAHFNRWSQ